jgi:hypothetical protein
MISREVEAGVKVAVGQSNGIEEDQEAQEIKGIKYHLVDQESK